MAYGPRDPKAIAKDLCIALAHPEYRDADPLDTLQLLKEARR